MPELPEVESTVRYLRERLLGCKVAAAEVLWPRTIADTKPADFSRTVCGKIFSKVERRGKYLIFTLESSKGRDVVTLLGHLRMSGSMDVVKASSPLGKHDRVVIGFTNGKQLRFNDPRKFGRLILARDPENIIGRLGPEPIDPDFNWQRLLKLLEKKRAAIKPLLLNQSFIAGVGNIYADESLWKARMHPLRMACSVSVAEARSLAKALSNTLLKAIDASGTDFGDGVVEGGGYKPQIYGRENLPCRRCKTVIAKISVGQRGTHFCPNCQRL